MPPQQACPPLPGTQVNVLQTGTLTSVVTGTLSPALEFASNVPAGQEEAVIESAEECPGECIFIEVE